MGARDTLDIVMTLAAQEAMAAGYAEITTAHLVIALSRAAETDTPLAMSTDNAAIRREFEVLGIAPRRFRRRLRALLGHGEAQHQGEPMHRSPTCKAVFARAEQIAHAEHVPCHVSHLVRAAFAVWATDSGTDGTREAPGEVVPSDDDIPAAL